MSANQVFTQVFNNIKNEIPFNKEWSNGSGYFDHAITGPHAVKIKNEEIIKSVTPGGRRIIFIGTRLGTIAVFDRFTEQENKDNEAVFVHNTTSAVSQGCWFSNTALTESELLLLLGEYGYTGEYNLGWRIEQLFSAMKKTEGR